MGYGRNVKEIEVVSSDLKKKKERWKVTTYILSVNYQIFIEKVWNAQYCTWFSEGFTTPNACSHYL